MTEKNSPIREGTHLENIPEPLYNYVDLRELEHDARHREDRLNIKTATWGRLFVGDCGEEPGATLTLRSDGTASFECVTWTNSTWSGDHWWASFLIRDKDNVMLHSEPFHQGPAMGEGHPPPRYRWGFSFRFDASKFAAITQVRYAYKC